MFILKNDTTNSKNWNMMKNLHPSNFLNAIFEFVKLVTHFHAILSAVQVKKVSSCSNEEMSNNSDKVGGFNPSFSRLNSQFSILNSQLFRYRGQVVRNSQLSVRKPSARSCSHPHSCAHSHSHSSLCLCSLVGFGGKRL